MAGAAALLGLIGVIEELPMTIQIYFILLGFILPAAGVLFVRWPQKFLRGYG